MSEITTTLLRCLLPFVLMAMAVPARAGRFDIASFDPPRGWEVERRERLMAWTTINQHEGYYCRITLYAAEPSSGDARRDFESEWQAVMVNDASADRRPQPRPARTRSGLDYQVAPAALEGGGIRHFGELNVVSIAGRVQSVKVTGSNEARFAHCRGPASAFLDSLRYADAPVTTSAPAAATPPPAARPGGGGVAGVWMGVQQLKGYQKQPRPVWTVFFDDGRVYEDLPDEGLLYFDRAAAQRDPRTQGNWGGYRLEGGRGSLTKPGLAPIPIELLDANRLKLSLTTYHRTRPVDGVRLDGAWTTLSEPDDPWIDQQPSGQRPVIRFTPQGRFRDEGVFALHIKSGDPARDRAGEGEYDIRNYTLSLRYTDGREKRVAITSLLSAELTPRNEAIFLQRVRLNRRSR